MSSYNGIILKNETIITLKKEVKKQTEKKGAQMVIGTRKSGIPQVENKNAAQTCAVI